jgi:hypothetical protein
MKVIILIVLLLALAVVAIVLTIRNGNLKAKIKVQSIAIEKMQKGLFSYQDRIVKLTGQKPKDERKHSAVMKLQKKIAKHIYFVGDQVCLDVLRPKSNTAPTGSGGGGVPETKPDQAIDVDAYESEAR